METFGIVDIPQKRLEVGLSLIKGLILVKIEPTPETIATKKRCASTTPTDRTASGTSHGFYAGVTIGLAEYVFGPTLRI
jgi:hypothetical protein